MLHAACCYRVTAQLGLKCQVKCQPRLCAIALCRCHRDCCPCLQAAQLQSLRSSQQPNRSNSKPQVLLELMLLHADAPSDAVGMTSSSSSSVGYQRPLNTSTAAAMARAAAAAAGGGPPTSGYSSGDELEDGFDMPATLRADADDTAASFHSNSERGGDLQLLVLVSAASNVPLVPGCVCRLVMVLHVASLHVEVLPAVGTAPGMFVQCQPAVVACCAGKETRTC